MKKQEIKEKLKISGIVPVVAIEDENDALPLAKALIQGGINFIEVTFRTKSAQKCIKIISDNLPDMIVGAGTVINEEQFEKSIEAGAKFIVSPGYDEKLVELSQKNDVLIIPGVVTPTEIMKGINQGLDILKFFPADSFGGVKTLKSFQGPFESVKFMPTGGITQENLLEYYNTKNVISVGGSWICSTNLIKNKKFDEITSLTKKAMQILGLRQN